MERGKAVTVAATASLTLLAGATGIALASGLLRPAGPDPLGQLSPLQAPAPVDQQLSGGAPVPSTVSPEPWASTSADAERGGDGHGEAGAHDDD